MRLRTTLTSSHHGDANTHGGFDGKSSAAGTCANAATADPAGGY
ncbi:hypothetical protein [Granulibacter bethesdensis]|nr:hypothetical protein [Granulibacter bethesdensis]